MDRIYFDAGHGGSDPGAVKYVREADVAIKVVKYACAYLRENYDCEVYQDITADSTHTISANANKWNADLFVSVHFNAGGGDGYENYVYSSKNKKLGEMFWKHVQKTGQNAHGVPVKYDPTLNVLRLTDMPAILNEIAFVDNKKDIKGWDENAELKKMGIALAEAAADYLNTKKKSTKPKYQTLMNLNLRSSANLDSKVLVVVPKGKILSGSPVLGGWLKTTYDGKSGYVRVKGEKTYCKKL